MKKLQHHDVIEQVPLDYYQKGVKNNVFQKAWHTRKLQMVLGQISSPPETILDVGCASGWFLSQVQKKFPKAKCTGIDIYKDAIRYGKKKYPKMSFYVSDAGKLPFKAQSFDLVICTEVLEHVNDPSGVISEMKRVLRKKGQLVIELDSGSILFTIVWYLWGLSRGSVWHHAHLHSFTVRKLENLLKRSGFAIERKRQFNLGMAMVFSARKK